MRQHGYRSPVPQDHYKYPYLLKDFRNDAGQVLIDRANKVWSTDITYIKLEKGFVYLAAIIDWHSKKYSLGNSLILWILLWLHLY